MAHDLGIYGCICILFLLMYFLPVWFMFTDFWSLTGLITAIVSGTSRASTSPVSAAQRNANIQQRPSRWSRADWPVWKSVPKRPVKPDSLCWDTRDNGTLVFMHTCTALKCVLTYDYHSEGRVWSFRWFISSIWQDKGNYKITAAWSSAHANALSKYHQEMTFKFTAVNPARIRCHQITNSPFLLQIMKFFVCVIVLINTVSYRNHYFSSFVLFSQITIYHCN